MVPQLPLCRKHLFSSLYLISNLSLEHFGDLLSKNPDIARYARSLSYEVHNPTSDMSWIFSTCYKNALPYYGRLDYSLQNLWTGTPSMNWCDRPWYPWSICPQLLTSTSPTSKTFLQRRSRVVLVQVVATSSTSSLESFIWILMKSIRSSYHVVKYQHQYCSLSGLELGTSKNSWTLQECMQVAHLLISLVFKRNPGPRWHLLPQWSDQGDNTHLDKFKIMGEWLVLSKVLSLKIWQRILVSAFASWVGGARRKPRDKRVSDS